MLNLPIDSLFPELDCLPSFISISDAELEDLISVASELADEYEALHALVGMSMDRKKMQCVLLKDFLQDESISESAFLYLYSEEQLRQLNTKVSRNLLLLLNSTDDQGYQCFVEKLDSDSYFTQWKLSANIWFKGKRYKAVSSEFRTNYSSSEIRYLGARDSDNKCLIQIKEI